MTSFPLYSVYLLATLIAICCIETNDNYMGTSATIMEHKLPYNARGGIIDPFDMAIAEQDKDEEQSSSPFRRQVDVPNPTQIQCGGRLTAPQGIIQTPNFPGKFHVPITCVWVIDASGLSFAPNVSIVVYPTQLYILSGLTFTEYMYYGHDYKVRSERFFQFTEQNVTTVSWIQFTSPYLEITFTMQTLYGTHLRALDRLLDVYGFNITYEVGALKSYQCNALKCRFLGHCYADSRFSSFYCSCFPGYAGADCGHGPLCEDRHANFCQNGGTCKQIGVSAVTCLCSSGYRGVKCEVSEDRDEFGCSTNIPRCQDQCSEDKATETRVAKIPTTKIASSQSKLTCKCKDQRKSNHKEMWRYQITMRINNNFPTFHHHLGSESLRQSWEDDITTNLKRQVS